MLVLSTTEGNNRNRVRKWKGVFCCCCWLYVERKNVTVLIFFCRAADETKSREDRAKLSIQVAKEVAVLFDSKKLPIERK